MPNYVHVKILFVTMAVITLAFALPKEAEAAFILKSPPYIGLNSGLVGFWSFDGKTVFATSTCRMDLTMI